MNTQKRRISTLDSSLAEQREYWLNRLSRPLGDSRLRPDVEWTSVDGYEPGLVNAVIVGPGYDRLIRLTGESPFLIYATMLASLYVCLNRYTGSNSMAVGSPSVRSDEEPDRPPNMLAIVTEINGGQSLRELLLTVRQTLIDAYARQDYPFERLKRRLNRLDDGLESRRGSLFSLVLMLTGFHDEQPRMKNDVTGVLTKQSAGLQLSFTFNRLLFTTETLSRFVDHYVHLVDSATSDIESGISDLDMLGEAERRQLLFDWNDTTAEMSHLCAHQIIERQTRLTPDAIAITADDLGISYLETNRQANRLAHALRELGVDLDVTVGVCLDRSPDLIIAALAVMKVGGAYLPLDPTYPPQRLEFMVEDANLSILLTRRNLLAIDSDREIKIVCLDTDRELIDRHESNDPEVGVSPENLAYVIYTSGSTGRPKGVMIEHRSFCNLASAQQFAFNQGGGSRILQFASFSFDASAWEIIMALSTGATLCLGDAEGRFSAGDLRNVIRRHAITTVTFPPAMLAMISPEDCPSLRTVISAGEACSPGLAETWSEGRRFFNAYGPTETTVCASMIEVQRRYSATVPIGRPLRNMRVYCLDSGMGPVGINVPGELFVGGAGLARGYMRAPDLTAARFLPDPISGERGGRLYRTGDISRLLSDGNIDFFGRADLQVKIRGFRVELGEVEWALCQHPSVRQAVAIMRNDSGAGHRVVAYVVPDQDQGLTVSAVLSFLRGRLPEYMLPGAVVFLEKLPLNANGKIDRAALPLPAQERPDLEDEFVEPRTQTEKRLAEIWSNLLGIEQIGVNDRFFELGGHSLLATRLISRIRDAFEVELPLRRIFEGPTIAGLAAAVDSMVTGEISTDAENVIAPATKRFEEQLEELNRLSLDEVRAFLEDEQRYSSRESRK